jgi:rhodanese-related sulfurtransferase
VTLPPLRPPAAVDELLAQARGRLARLYPRAVLAAMHDGALLIDIRSEVQRGQDGVVPGSLFVPRNVLEWRCDPSSPHHDPRTAEDRQLILMCNEGYQSSLAAATLHQLGLTRTTDLVGGFQGWRAAGLPIVQLDPGADSVSLGRQTGEAFGAEACNGPRPRAGDGRR